MAVFKTLKKKDKRYIFDFQDNRKDENPAAVIFSRFPLPGEDFSPRIKHHGLKTNDPDAVAESLVDRFYENMGKTDYPAFLKECVDRFEDFSFDGEEIKTVDEFLAINPDAWNPIAADIYRYAKESDEFEREKSKA